MTRQDLGNKPTVTNVTVLATGPLVSLVLAVVALAILLLRRRELLAKTGP